MSKKIVVIVDENGEIELETIGFKGKGCIAESKWIKDLLGEEKSRQLTPTYFMKETDKGVKKKYIGLCG